jgi:hypothetical protein
MISQWLYTVFQKNKTKIPLHIDKPQSTTSDKERCNTSCALYYTSGPHCLLRT